MTDPIPVMVESGKKKKRIVAVAYSWPGWDRSAKTEQDALRVLAAYRPRYAEVAALAGLADAFTAAGELSVVERVEGNSMTDYFGLSAMPAQPEQEQMTDAQCERSVFLLQASWTYFDDTAANVSPELRKGPRGGGRDRDAMVRHTNASEIDQFAKKVGVRSPIDAWRDAGELRAHRDAFCAGIREFNASGPFAGRWTVQFLIRRCAWHMLDHAWEMEDRDQSKAR